jgi:RecJ-like exonuclease
MSNTGYIEVICTFCNGSGEGMYDGSTCISCHGSGVKEVECSHCNEDDPALDCKTVRSCNF